MDVPNLKQLLELLKGKLRVKLILISKMQRFARIISPVHSVSIMLKVSFNRGVVKQSHLF